MLVISLVKGGETTKIVVEAGTTITEEMLKSHITVEEGYEIEGYYTDEAYTNKFDFTNPLNSDITIYARIAEISQEKPEEKPAEEPEESTPEKDDVPKTGVDNYLGLAIIGIIGATAGLIYMKRK